LVSGDDFPLVGGNIYWIVASGQFATDIWNFNTTTTTPSAATRFQNDSWNPNGGTPPAMRITAVVPEPASLGVVLLGGLGLLRRRRV
jgi:hypothetical protein